MKRAIETGGGAAGQVAIFPQASELAETGADAGKMRKAAVDKTPAGQLATGRNLTLSVLKAGMTYRLDRR
jgi:hypothetical protein